MHCICLHFRPGHAPKIFIDEEQMSAHLQELNLDNSNINWQHNVEQRPWYTQQTNNNNDVVDFPRYISVI